MTTPTWDTYRVLPHRNVLDLTLYGADGRELTRPSYEHVPCGMDLKQHDIEDNWCGHCAEPISKAASARAKAHRNAA